MAPERHTLLKEYEVCQDSVESLEALVWQSAATIGLVSVGTLALVATSRPSIPTIIIVGAFSTAGTVLWWRLANRWWSVQRTKLQRMWDIEEDLSRLFPDVVAHRLAEGGRAFAAWQREAATRLAENLAEYLTEEQPLVARPADVDKFSRQADALREDAARLLAAAAKLGHVAASYNLGLFYLEGRLFPQDFARAAELFRTAAEAGSPEAQYALGTFYKEGRGVMQNYVEAARCNARTRGDSPPVR